MKNLNINIIAFILVTILLGCSGNEDTVAPFKTYSSLISQEGNNTPAESILVNDLGITITWTRQDVGIFKGILSKPVDLNKTTLIIQLREGNRIAIGGFINASTIVFNSADRYNLYDSHDEFSNGVIEIKSYNAIIAKETSKID